jgi:hypothetical protein
MLLSREKIRLLAGLGLLSVIFFLLRAGTIGHLLMWDEAWNILSLRAFLSNATADPFYWYFRFHPPLYMLFASLLSPFQGFFAERAEVLSLLFSYSTFVIVFFLSNRIGGWRYAFLSGLFLCILPVSMGYDTWVKRDCLAMALGYLSILLLLDKKFLWSAVVLSFSLLGKESAFFFFLAVFVLLFVLDEKQKTKIISTFLLAAFLLTAWWYIPLSNLTKEVLQYYFSGAVYGDLWANPPLYYAKKLIPDLGMPVLAFCVIGLFYSVYRTFLKKEPEWSVPIVVTACVYIPISLVFATKTPWLSVSAAPALAMTAGAGALYLLERSNRIKLFFPVFCVLIASAVMAAMAFSYQDYHMETYPNGWPGARSSRELAEYLNAGMKDDDRLMITEFAYWRMPLCPVFIYYWKPHEIMIVRNVSSPEKIIEEMKKYRVSWFVVADSPDPKYNYHALVISMKELLREDPGRVGWSYVWKTDILWAGKTTGSDSKESPR